MRIIAVSDSHGCSGLLRKAVEQATRFARVDVFVHCGDGMRDMGGVAPILQSHNADIRLYTVRGNCDVGAADYPALELFEVNGVRMMAAHGDQYRVKSDLRALRDKARDLGAQVAFFGHTHQPLLEAAAGVYLINPGSLAHPLQGNIAYAQVVVQADGRYRADLMPWLS